MKLVFGYSDPVEVPDEYAPLIFPDDRFTIEGGSQWKVRYRSWKIHRDIKEGMTLYVYLDKVQ